jgi:GTP-binding protein
VQIASAKFLCSAPDLESCPDDSIPEFAFIGRSNVGKSTLLNMLAGQEGLARVSPLPGFTKLINMFTINQQWRLVDLPGYGYAQVARAHKARFNTAVSNYLQHRTNLRGVFALVDSGLPPQAIDLEFVEWLATHAIPFMLVFTKTDKVSPATVEANIEAFKARIAEWCDTPPEILTCSAVAREGRRALLEAIEAALALPPREAAAPAPAPNVELPPEVLPPIGKGMLRRRTGERPRVSPKRPW